MQNSVALRCTVGDRIQIFAHFTMFLTLRSQLSCFSISQLYFVLLLPEIRHFSLVSWQVVHWGAGSALSLEVGCAGIPFPSVMQPWVLPANPCSGKALPACVDSRETEVFQFLANNLKAKSSLCHLWHIWTDQYQSLSWSPPPPGISPALHPNSPHPYLTEIPHRYRHLGPYQRRGAGTSPPRTP